MSIGRRCTAICSDGAKAMTSSKSGFITRPKELMPKAFFITKLLRPKPCHRNTIKFFNIIIKIINSIKRKALQARLLRIICEDMGSLHQNLLHLHQSRSEYSKFICDPKFLLKLAFLSDLFKHLNTFNKSLQRKDKNVISVKDKIYGFKKKIICGYHL